MSLNTLNKLGASLDRLELDQGDALTDLSLVRLVPNKRLVCKAHWRQTPVFAKIFIGDKAAQYASRDERGAAYLLSAEVNSPSLLASVQIADSDGLVLIYQAIENSINVQDAYHQIATENVGLFMALLVKVVASLHQSKLMQTDLHLQNFLLKDEDLYVLDGDGIRQYTDLSDQQAQRNLAVLLSKFDPIDCRQQLAAMLQTYQAVRPDVNMKADEIAQLIHHYRSKATSDYADKKVLRTCTDVAVTRTSQYFLAQATQFESVTLPKNVTGYDALVTSGEALKRGNTATVALANIDGDLAVIKRYNIKSLSHLFGRLFRKTRASVSWSNAHRLKLLNIPTPAPIALYEKRYFGLLRGQAYFVSAYVDAPDMQTFFTQSATAPLLIQKTVTLFYRMHLLWLSHGDTKATNIKVFEGSQPMLIDLDSMRQHTSESTARRAHIRDLKRFMRNWEAKTELYDAFVKTFKAVYHDEALLFKAGILRK